MLKTIVAAIYLMTSVASAKGPDAKVVIAKVESKWVQISDKTTTSVSKNATVSVHVSQRMINMRGNLIPVATLTTGEINSKAGEGVPKDLAGHIASISKIKTWKKSNRGSYTAYEAFVPKTAQYVKLFVSNNKSKGAFKYSVASIRGAYMMPVYYEAEFLQRAQMDNLKHVASLDQPEGFWANLYSYFVNPAYAFGLSDLMSWLSGAGNKVDSGIGAVNGVSTSVNGASGTLQSVGSNLTGAINNGVSTAASKADGAIGAVNNLSGEVGSIQGTVADSVQTLHGDIGSVNAQIKDTTAVVNKFTDPWTMGKVALATGFGYSLGSMLAQFAVTGAVDAAHDIFNEVMGQMTPDQKDLALKRSKDSWDQLNKLSEKVAEVDMNVQVRLQALAAVTGKSPDQVIPELDYQSAKMANNLAKINKALEAGDFDDKTERACFDAQKKMTDQIEVWKAVRKIVQHPEQRTKASLCEGFQDFYQQWTDSELQMRVARNILMRNMYSMVANNNEEAANSTKEEIGFQAGRKKGNDCDDSASLKEANSMVKKNDCDCNPQSTAPWTPICSQWCARQTNYQSSVNSCKNIIALDGAIDPNAEGVDMSTAVAKSSQALEAAKLKMVRASCVAGSTTGVCNGSDGSFTQTVNKMRDEFQHVQAQCGADNVIATEAPGQILQGQKMAQMAVQAGAQQALPLADAPASTMPSDSQRGGFFSGLGKFFSGSGKATASNTDTNSPFRSGH